MASSSFSSSDIDSSAVDTLIAEATDLCALEQMAALNTAHLPQNLESRFQKLKSFPPLNQQEMEKTPERFNPHEIEPKSETREVVKPTRRGTSPSRQVCGCFNLSLSKRVQTRERMGEEDDEISEILSGIGSESMKLKKAWKEQEKASREADKMVKWVSQVSQRINEAAIDELLKEEFK